MSAVQKPLDLKVSKLSENIIGSEIIKLAAEVNEKIKKGEKIYNLTIGDFNPKVFPIPTELKQNIVDAYFDDQTNYPAADGMLELREAVSKLLKERGGLDRCSNICFECYSGRCMTQSSNPHKKRAFAFKHL